MYFELEVLQPAGIYVGLTNTVKQDEEEDAEIDPLELLEGHGCHLTTTDVGDVISCTYDQANYPTFSVYINGALLESVTGTTRNSSLDFQKTSIIAV